MFSKHTCDICNKKFSSREKLMQHLDVYHYKDTPYDCKVCQESFSNMQDMREHLQKKHSY